jgi:DNA-binding GntR family transcriptional regulator
MSEIKQRRGPPSFHLPALDLQPVGRKRLHEQILAQIKERLITGQFAPGQKLPLRSLAEALGTSAMPVRDALQRLESIGVLTADPHRPMEVPILDSRQLDEIREIRVALEGVAAERAARHAGSEALAALDTCFDRLAAAARSGDPTAFFRANWLFHCQLVAAGASSVMMGMIEPLWLKMGPVLRLSKPDAARMMKAVPVHGEITAAIRQRNPAAARAAVARDINGCFDMLAGRAAGLSS